MPYRSVSFRTRVWCIGTFFLIMGLSAAVNKASSGQQAEVIRDMGGDAAKIESGGSSVSAGIPSDPDISGKGSSVAREWGPLIERLAADGFDREELSNLFSRPEVVLDRSPMVSKMDELYEPRLVSEITGPIQRRLAELGYEPGPPNGKMGAKTRRAIMAFQYVHGIAVDGKPSMALLRQLKEEHRKAPPTVSQLYFPPKVTPLVYESVLQPERIAEARDFLAQNEGLLGGIHQRYGISPKVAVGLLALETRVGNYLGEKEAFTTLSSMANSTDLGEIEPFLKNQPITPSHRIWLQKKCRQKADWAYAELKALLRYAKKNEVSLVGLLGSVYGAIGICQFMPTNALRYGVDGDGDGRIDLFKVEDALPSMGNFMVHHGWRKGLNDRKALYHYNHSNIYVNTIITLAEQL